MTGRSANSTGRKGSRTNKFLVSVILVVLLSLVSWTFFYMKQMPLASAETSVVVGFWLLIVFGTRWILNLIGRSKRHTTVHAKGHSKSHL
ncbi:MAG TPA: hypothetical protein VFB43_04350 [Terracidiphilus sp.]|nr:hypothetical protein [Terracidiphilus sp.]